MKKFLTPAIDLKGVELEELVKSQFLDRLGGIRFYGVVKNKGEYFGYALSFVPGKYALFIDAIGDYWNKGLGEMNKRLTMAGFGSIGKDVMITPKGIPIVIDAEGLFIRDFKLNVQFEIECDEARASNSVNNKEEDEAMRTEEQAMAARPEGARDRAMNIPLPTPDTVPNLDCKSFTTIGLIMS